MKKIIHGFAISTDVENDLIHIAQENHSAESGEDTIALDPCQIDLLIKLLTQAKEEFSEESRRTGNTNAEVYNKPMMEVRKV